jgi:tetratricopeptide (TPR) repeat protein
VSKKRRKNKKQPTLGENQFQSPETISPQKLASRRAQIQIDSEEAKRRRGHELLAEGARLLGLRRAGEAAKVLEKAHQLLPDSVDVAINLGGAYVLQRRYNQAVSTLEQASQMAPDNATVWVNLAAAYLGRLETSGPQRQDQAIAAYQRALQIDDRAPNVHYNLGLIFKDRRDWQRAREYFLHALEVDQGDRDARYWLDHLAALPAGTKSEVTNSAHDPEISAAAENDRS